MRRRSPSIEPQPPLESVSPRPARHGLRMEDREGGPEGPEELDGQVPCGGAGVELTRSRVDAELLRQDPDNGDQSDDDGENEEASHPIDPSLRDIGTVN
jgi:hypothetical protein